MKTSDLIDVPATLPSNCPTLILQGELDPWTTAAEIDRVDRDLRGTKQIQHFPAIWSTQTLLED